MYREGEPGAGGLDGEDGRAQVAVVLEVVYQRLPRAGLHAPVYAHVLRLGPANYCIHSIPITASHSLYRNEDRHALPLITCRMHGVRTAMGDKMP